MKPFNSVGTLVVLTFLEGFSFFGRTSALSPFLPSLCSDLSLSMTQISGAYMLANLIAGLLLPFVGGHYDRQPLSHFLLTFIVIFGASFLLIGTQDADVFAVVGQTRCRKRHFLKDLKSVISQEVFWIVVLVWFVWELLRDGEMKRVMGSFVFLMLFQLLLAVCKPIHGWHFYPLAVLGCAFIGIRIAVQAYALAGRSWLATHFSRRCGLATGFVQLFLTVITASTPVICYNISRHWTWGIFFCTLGAVWLVGLFVCSFLPDEQSRRTKRPMQTATAGTIRQSHHGRRLLFVFIWFTLFFRNAQNSGVAFHLVPMCRDFGVNAKTVSAAFMPISLLAVGMTFLFGHYFKRIGSRTVLWLFLLSDAGMLYAVKHIDVSGMLWLFIACTGFYWGINNIIASMVIPVLFGTNRIGALNGFAFGAISLGSAVGPFFFSVMRDATSYKSALALCIGGVFLLLCLFALLQNRIKSAEAGAWNS